MNSPTGCQPIEKEQISRQKAASEAEPGSREYPLEIKAFALDA
jgi:hypothetical protein